MSNPEAPPVLPADLKFEAALAELEALVQTMEGGKLELEDSITAYRRGMALLLHCQGQLTAAEQKIQIMEAGQLKDWNPEGERP
ncbi:exodeoxyribonuclease VII small subunit [Azovibrio restrictus]|uniref:exodeoxyribonuclease VII small subunit n=1 Tax=Azovibrio restrictus TaxID=146938 RepID=UPI0026F2ABB4|nr:exodeoxyribonuclease VII small subunit [Azovibrio restrictus]MDD3482682.1 exodeoxyribonuclease VII small subunit [Azovibrio restrictus]